MRLFASSGNTLERQGQVPDGLIASLSRTEGGEIFVRHELLDDGQSPSREPEASEVPVQGRSRVLLDPTPYLRPLKVDRIPMKLSAQPTERDLRENLLRSAARRSSYCGCWRFGCAVLNPHRKLPHLPRRNLLAERE